MSIHSTIEASLIEQNGIMPVFHYCSVFWLDFLLYPEEGVQKQAECVRFTR